MFATWRRNKARKGHLSAMPSLEESERYGGAAFLGVPAFDGFIWMLDNYARLELLVKLHDQLPAFLVNPATAFICTCIGLVLLYLSNARQLRRVGTTSSEPRLVDTSETEYRRIERPKWLVPVLIVFALALIATPIMAVGYSLAYKGTPPSEVASPQPPYFAFSKTMKPSMAQAPFHIEQHTQGPNSPNVVGNSNQFNYSYEPFTRTFNDSQIAMLKENLSSGQTVPFWLIIETRDHQSPGRETSDEQGVFANQLASLLVAAGWADREDECDKGGPCQRPNLGFKYENVNDHGIVITTPPELLGAAQKLSAELDRLLFRNVVRTVQKYMGAKLDVIVIEIGPA